MSHDYPWAAAYVSAVLETDKSRMPKRIASAESAISERSCKPDVTAVERQAIESAKAALITLWKEHVGIGAFLILRLFDDSLLAQF